MLSINRKPGDRILELGGGDNPLVHPTCMGGTDVNVDVRMVSNSEGKQTVDFVADFNQPLALKDTEFNHVFSHFCLEHLSFRSVLNLLKEVFRVLKHGGTAVFAIPNTEAQIRWIQDNGIGWDGKDLFTAASELLYGSQDYPENTHKCYFSPIVAENLFREAGFSSVSVSPYGARNTDMVITAGKGTSPPLVRPVIGEAAAVDKRKSAVMQQMTESVMGIASPVQEQLASEAKQALKEDGKEMSKQWTREEMFDRHYFNGGGKVGGYSREGYRDFPVHEITFQHILKRRPKSVLEIGAARGYLVKRFQDHGIRACGMEISRHCWMTRACNGIIEFDICKTPWPWKDQEFDLCYSVATLEHIPEEHLHNILREMARVSVGGLHGVDFGHNDDGFDKTHCTLKEKGWWQAKFHHMAGLTYPVEIVNKEELEQGNFPQEVLQGDGKLKLNVGSFTTMHHHGWLNIDLHNLMDFANQNGYRFLHHDVRNGLPFKTGEVDLISSQHFFEHLTYDEGLRFLRECRRVLKPDTGAIRIAVPDADLLNGLYSGSRRSGRWYGKDLSYFDEISDGCASTKSQAKKLWALLHEGHQACYDQDTLEEVFHDSGFTPSHTNFREVSFNRTGLDQVKRETIDMQPELSLYMEAIPLTA